MMLDHTTRSTYRRRILRATLAACSVLVCLGCNSNAPTTAPVHGKVLLNGRPLTTGRVLTTPSAGRGANGVIAEDGTFELNTRDLGSGALLGTHKVAIVAYEGQGSGPEAGAGKLLVPQRYTNPETSELTITVKANEENAPILELKSP